MSFQDISITIRAVNRASAEFARVSADAEKKTCVPELERQPQP